MARAATPPRLCAKSSRSSGKPPSLPGWTITKARRRCHYHWRSPDGVVLLVPASSSRNFSALADHRAKLRLTAESRGSMSNREAR
jgi:hypothetical protein